MSITAAEIRIMKTGIQPSSPLVTFVKFVAKKQLTTPLADLLAKPAAQKAADYLLPALFGALAVVYVSRNPKIAFPPVILMVALCIAIPKIESIISILVPFVALFTVGVARIMYKKGWLGKNEPEKNAVDVETNNVALDTEDTDKFIDELDNK